MLRVQVQMARPKLTYHRIGSIYPRLFLLFCCCILLPKVIRRTVANRQIEYCQINETYDVGIYRENVSVIDYLTLLLFP